MQIKKILLATLIATSLVAGSSFTAATAAPTTGSQVVTAAKLSAAQQLKARKAVDSANSLEYAAVLVTGYGKKKTSAAKALVSYATKYIAKKGYELEVVTLDGRGGGLTILAASDDTTITMWVEGRLIHDGEVYNAPAGTKSVTVLGNVRNLYASYTVDGNVDLQPGDNIVSFSVTAPDGEIDVFNVIVNVAE